MPTQIKKTPEEIEQENKQAIADLLSYADTGKTDVVSGEVEDNTVDATQVHASLGGESEGTGGENGGEGDITVNAGSGEGDATNTEAEQKKAAEEAAAASAAGGESSGAGEDGGAEGTAAAGTEGEGDGEELTLEKQAEEHKTREDAMRQLINEMAAQGMATQAMAATTGGGVAGAGGVSLPAGVPPEGGQQPATQQAAAVPAKQEDAIGALAALLSPDAIKMFNDNMEAGEQFLSDEEADQVIDNPKVLQGAFLKAVKFGAKNVLSVVPAIMNNMLRDWTASTQRAQEFYEKNKDLTQYRDLVSLTFAKVYKENVNNKEADLEKLTAQEARKRLQLPDPEAAVKAVKPKGKDGAGKPAFAGGKKQGRKPGAGDSTGKTDQQGYINEILN